ncbi:MAG: DUF3877 family protein [Lachnospiraceae bacterium]|nr:DUF3877 family protein [Lachnospiraceae bacterium]
MNKQINTAALLAENLMEVVWEQQLKLGYLEESVRLYYPLSTLNHLLQSEYSTEQMQAALEACDALPEPIRSGLRVSHQNDRFCLHLQTATVSWIHSQLQPESFWPQLIKLMKSHQTTFEQVKTLFSKYSSSMICQAAAHDEFDWLLYFADGQPDGYYYCFKQEGHHLTYHRFLKEDYEELELGKL